jgi:hypothetical protein
MMPAHLFTPCEFFDQVQNLTVRCRGSAAFGRVRRCYQRGRGYLFDGFAKPAEFREGSFSKAQPSTVAIPSSIRAKILPETREKGCDLGYRDFREITSA